MVTPEVLKALDHVRSFHPELNNLRDNVSRLSISILEKHHL